MENINEAPVVAAATKVVAGMAKAGAKAAAKGAKVAAKTTKKGAKVVSKVKSTADTMAGGFDKNKDLIKNKRGLPSKKVANSGKKTVDPKKNNLPDMSKTQPDGVDNKTSQKTTSEINLHLKNQYCLNFLNFLCNMTYTFI